MDDTKLNTIIAAWPMLETRHNYSADKLREMYEKLVYYGKRVRPDGTVEVISHVAHGIGRRGGLVIVEHAARAAVHARSALPLRSTSRVATRAISSRGSTRPASRCLRCSGARQARIGTPCWGS